MEMHSLKSLLCLCLTMKSLFTLSTSAIDTVHLEGRQYSQCVNLMQFGVISLFKNYPKECAWTFIPPSHPFEEFFLVTDMFSLNLEDDSGSVILPDGTIINESIYEYPCRSYGNEQIVPEGCAGYDRKLCQYQSVKSERWPPKIITNFESDTVKMILSYAVVPCGLKSVPEAEVNLAGLNTFLSFILFAILVVAFLIYKDRQYQQMLKLLSKNLERISAIRSSLSQRISYRRPPQNSGF